MTSAALRIAWHEYITNVRRPAFLLATFVLPFVGIAVLALVLGMAAPTVDRWAAAETARVGVVDATGNLVPIQPAYVAHYQAFATEEDARVALNAGQLSGYLVADPAFRETGEVMAWTRRDVRIQRDGLSRAWLRPFLLAAILRGRVDEATLAVVESPSFGDVEAQVLGGPLRDDRRATQIGVTMAPFFVAMLLAMTIFAASNYLLRSVTEEKENRVLEMLLCAVTPMDLLTGKVLGLGALSVTQVAVWPVYAAVPLVLGSLAPPLRAALDPVLIAFSLVYFVLGYLQFAVLMAAAGALGTNMRESQQIGGQFALFSMIPFFLAPMLLFDPNLGLARFLSFVPLFAPTMMMMRLPFGQVPALDIALSLAISAVTVPAVIWGSARVFRASLLVYGKRLTVREILGALRQA